MPPEDLDWQRLQTLRAREQGIDATTCPVVPPILEPAVLLISHVLGKLSKGGERDLLDVVTGSRAVVWVEPGSRDVSRRLSEIRDGLIGSFAVLAPCTHKQACGALAGERDWCHFFAAPPPEVFTDPHWVHIGRRLGLDLRALPYAFFVLRRRDAAEPVGRPTNDIRILGRPLVRPKFARLFACGATGLGQIDVFKNRHAELYRELRKPTAPLRILPRAERKD